jgi:parvulin-like peptidyl-prolyl isomerase
MRMKSLLVSGSKFGRVTFIPLILLGLSCRQSEEARPPAGNSSIVACVGGTAISVEAFTKELARRFPQSTGEDITSTQQKSVLEKLIRNETLYANAVKSGFDRTPEMEANIKELVIAKFKEKQFAPAEISASDQEIEAYYRSHASRFTKPLAARGAVIFVACPVIASAEKRELTRARAEAIAREANAASDKVTFARLVTRYSDDQSTRYRGGETGWLSPDSSGFAPKVIKALLALNNQKESASLVETPCGFWIVKLLEHRDAAQQPLVQVKDLIRHELSSQRSQAAEHEFYSQMAQGLNIQINQAVLDSIKLPSKRSLPPSLPGTRTASIESQSRL